jgi:hypothetical protein
MPKIRSEDITPVIIRRCVTYIRQAATNKEAIKIFIAFCERYRKNYAARRSRIKYRPQKNSHASKKWWDANKDEYNQKRNAANRAKAEEEWRNGLRKRKPRHLLGGIDG